jgi:general secretion pathway protein M
MMALITPWWNDRSGRERLLLGLMLLLLAGLLLWLAVLRPLAAARADADAEARAAQARLASARALVAAIRARPPATSAPVLDVVSRRLAEAGLQPARLEGQGQGQAVLDIAAINGRLLLGWAAALEQRDGLVIDELVASRNDDQSVKAHIVVRKAQ